MDVFIVVVALATSLCLMWLGYMSWVATISLSAHPEIGEYPSEIRERVERAYTKIVAVCLWGLALGQMWIGAWAIMESL